ncbi:MAG: AAA family ATPase [Chloroflexi bacterium]|nr:AAA family ATPase [Chloroflexota bacterium]
MGKIYAIANQKGGVGKTTTAVNLGAALVERGRSVLLIDFDPQASLTLALGFNPDTIEPTIYNALAAAIDEDGQPSLSNIVVHSKSGLDVVPSNIELSQAEMDLISATSREMILREMLDAVRNSYDYVIVDCQPSLGLLTINALSAADEVIIPLQADYLAVKGVDLLLKTIFRVQRKLNHSLQIAGVLLTMADVRTIHARDVIDFTRSSLSGHIPVFETVIRTSVKLKEAPTAGESVLSYASETPAAEQYRMVAEEVERGKSC